MPSHFANLASLLMQQETVKIHSSMSQTVQAMQKANIVPSSWPETQIVKPTKEGPLTGALRQSNNC